MNKRADDDERRARTLYALTDQLQVQLRVLEETTPALDVRVVAQDSGDPETVVLVLTVQASRAAAEDLRVVLDQMRAISEAKRALREKARPDRADEVDLDAALQLLTTLSVKQLQAELHRQLDSMSEMGEMESLRLQMAMDRLTKLMTTLSNTLKKLADTASQITQNLK